MINPPFTPSVKFFQDDEASYIVRERGTRLGTIHPFGVKDTWVYHPSATGGVIYTSECLEAIVTKLRELNNV